MALISENYFFREPEVPSQECRRVVSEIKGRFPGRFSVEDLDDSMQRKDDPRFLNYYIMRSSDGIQLRISEVSRRVFNEGRFNYTTSSAEIRVSYDPRKNLRAREEVCSALSDLGFNKIG